MYITKKNHMESKIYPWKVYKNSIYLFYKTKLIKYGSKEIITRQNTMLYTLIVLKLLCYGDSLN